MNVVYLGGSITEGAGATSKDRSYVSFLSEYLKSIYHDEKINFYNASAGGTGSYFALFRLERDVFIYNPDLVFIEFAVNDRIYPSLDAAVYMESLIRKILNYNKNTKIVLLVTPTEMSDACGDVHKKIAYYYNTPVIDIQDYIWEQIGRGNFKWKDISADNLHPNDYGHKIYGEYIISFIKENKSILDNMPLLKEKSLMGTCYKNPTILCYEGANFYGHWREENLELKNKMNAAATSDNIGDCIEIYFKGKHLALMNLFSRYGGILEITIDDKYSFTLDSYMDIEGYFQTPTVANDLEDGEHRLILRINENRNAKSRGHRIVFGGLLVNQD